MSKLHRFTSLVTNPSPTHLVILVGLLLLIAILLRMVWRANPTTVVAMGVIAEAFSGQWKNVSMPLPLDRLLIGIGVLMIVLRGVRSNTGRRIVLRPIHFLLLAVGLYTTLSAFWVGTLGSGYGFYSLLDRLGLVPFLMYTLAPHFFGDRRQRNILLAFVVGLGLYLSVEGILESTGPRSLVFPRFITNPALGIQQSRTRGPYLSSDAMGISLFDCAVFAGIALTEWKDKWARRVCWTVLGLAPVAIFFTLTRADWLGTVVAGLVVMVAVPSLRKRLPHVLIGGVVVVLAALILVPGLSGKFSSRVGDQASVWDRYNTNSAAERITGAHPLVGVGWQRFQDVNWQYLRQAATYPLPFSSTNIEVHNVFLSHLAELGLLGGLAWILVLATGIGGSILRRGPPELRPWRLGLLAMAIMFVTVASLGPLSYAQANLFIWLTAGIVAVGRNSEPRPDADEEQALAPAHVPVLDAG